MIKRLPSPILTYPSVPSNSNLLNYNNNDFQQAAWGEFDKSQNPKGDICEDDLEALEEAFPLETADAFQQSLEDKPQRLAELKMYITLKKMKEVEGTAAVEAAIDFVQCELGVLNKMTIRVKRTGKIADDKEFSENGGEQKLDQVGGVVQCVLPNEDGTNTAFGVFPNDQSEITSRLRDCEIEHEFTVYQKEVRLKPEDHLRAKQASEVFKKVRDSKVAERPEKLQAKCGWGSKALMTYGDIIEKSKANIKAKRARTEAKLKAAGQFEHLEEEVEEEPAEVASKKRRRISVMDDAEDDAPKRGAKGAG